MSFPGPSARARAATATAGTALATGAVLGAAAARRRKARRRRPRPRRRRRRSPPSPPRPRTPAVPAPSPGHTPPPAPPAVWDPPSPWNFVSETTGPTRGRRTGRRRRRNLRCPRRHRSAGAPPPPPATATRCDSWIPPCRTSDAPPPPPLLPSRKPPVNSSSGDANRSAAVEAAGAPVIAVRAPPADHDPEHLARCHRQELQSALRAPPDMPLAPEPLPGTERRVALAALGAEELRRRGPAHRLARPSSGPRPCTRTSP